MNQSLIWLHEDALSVKNPVFSAAPAATEALFIWDNEYLKRMNYSFKRLVFIYECLLDLPANLLEGDTVSHLTQHVAKTIFVPSSTNPEINRILRVVADTKEVVIVPQVCFAEVTSNRDLKRFHAYWKLVESQVFKRNGGASEV